MLKIKYFMRQGKLYFLYLQKNQEKLFYGFDDQIQCKSVRSWHKISDYRYDIVFFLNSHNIVILQECEEKQAIDFAKNMIKIIFKDIEAKNQPKF